MYVTRSIKVVFLIYRVNYKVKIIRMGIHTPHSR
jgi:hypothetical protein